MADSPAVMAAEAFFRPASRAGAAFDQPPSHAQMRLGTAIGPSPGQMRLGTAMAPSYAQMRLGTAIAPGTARLGTASSGEGGARPMTSNKARHQTTSHDHMLCMMLDFENACLLVLNRCMHSATSVLS